MSPAVSSRLHSSCAKLPSLSRRQILRATLYTAPGELPSPRFSRPLAESSAENPFSQYRRKGYFARLMSSTTFGPLGRSLETKIRAAFSPSLLEIADNSHEHRGHAGVRDSKTPETHFSVRMVSDKFEGVSRVKRHQKVMGLLDEEFQEMGLHALELWLKTPGEVEK